MIQLTSLLICKDKETPTIYGMRMIKFHELKFRNDYNVSNIISQILLSCYIIMEKNKYAFYIGKSILNNQLFPGISLIFDNKVSFGNLNNILNQIMIFTEQEEKFVLLISKIEYNLIYKYHKKNLYRLIADNFIPIPATGFNFIDNEKYFGSLIIGYDLFHKQNIFLNAIGKIRRPNFDIDILTRLIFETELSNKKIKPMVIIFYALKYNESHLVVITAYYHHEICSNNVAFNEIEIKMSTVFAMISMLNMSKIMNALSLRIYGRRIENKYNLGIFMKFQFSQTVVLKIYIDIMGYEKDLRIEIYSNFNASKTSHQMKETFKNLDSQLLIN